MLTKLFPRNENRIDRGLRVAVGLVVTSLVFVGPQTPWALIGLVPLVTGIVGSCPLYMLLGINTCPIDGNTEPKTTTS